MPTPCGSSSDAELVQPDVPLVRRAGRVQRLRGDRRLPAEPWASMRSSTYFTDGPLPYASSSDRTDYPPPDPPTSVPTNRAEARLLQAQARQRRRSNGPTCSIARTSPTASCVRASSTKRCSFSTERIRRSRRPGIGAECFLPIFPAKKSKRNPAIVGQVNRARLGFIQINAGLNYYGRLPGARAAGALSRAQGSCRSVRRRRARGADRLPQLHAAARPDHRQRDDRADDGRQGELGDQHRAGAAEDRGVQRRRSAEAGRCHQRADRREEAPKSRRRTISSSR